MHSKKTKEIPPKLKPAAPPADEEQLDYGDGSSSDEVPPFIPTSMKTAAKPKSAAKPAARSTAKPAGKPASKPAPQDPVSEPEPAPESAPLTATTDRYIDPADYWDLPVEKLKPRHCKQIQTSMVAAVYATWDDFVKNQHNSPELWVNQYRHRLVRNGVNPDHAVGFLNKDSLGKNLAQTMGL